MKPTARVAAHSAEVNALAFCPANENILITGSADKVRLLSLSTPFALLTRDRRSRCGT